MLFSTFGPKKAILELKLNKEMFDALMVTLSNAFTRNIIEPGEMIGIIAAAAIGEPLTQMNLNSFHQSGVARMAGTVQGVPRMKELFRVSKNIIATQTSLYLLEDVRTKKEFARRLASTLRYTTFGEMYTRINVYYCPNNDNNDLTKQDNIVPGVVFASKNAKSGCQSDITGLFFLMRIEMNREKMAEKEISLMDIMSQFCSWWENRFTDSKNLKKEEKRVMNKITQIALSSNTDNDDLQVIHIRFNARDHDKDKFDLDTIYDFVHHILDKFKLKGINGIRDINAIPDEKVLRYDETTGNVISETEHVIYTNGANLYDIRYLQGIDLKRTITNDVVMIYNTFGIEIAKSVLLNEITNVLIKDDINYQHLSLVVDQMTITGSINSIDIHGLWKSDTDPFPKASFERPVEQLWNSAIFGESDRMRGVSSRIMVGQIIKGGTGYSDLILNTEMIEKSEYTENEYDNKYVEVKTETLINDIIKRSTNENDEHGEIFMPS